MRIQGIDSVRERDTFRLLRRNGTKIEIPIQSIPIADNIRMQNEIPIPVAPNEIVMRNGKPFKDDNGRIVREPNHDDADYQRRVSERNGLMMIAWIVAGTIWNQEVALDTDLGALSSDPQAGYRKVLAELSAFGFSTGDIQEWSLAIMSLSTPQREEVVAAKESFRNDGQADGSEA